MTIRMKLLSLVSVCGMVLSVTTAWAGGVGVEFLGAGAYSMASGTPTPTPGTGYGGGAILDFRIGIRSMFQLGGLYYSSVYSNPDLQRNTILHGLGGFKFLLNRSVSINLGGYYKSYSTNPQGLTGTDDGVYAGLGLMLYLGQGIAFLINPQYNYALSTLTSGNTSVTPHQVLGLVGLVFGVR